MGELAGLGGCRIGWQRPGRAESQPGQKGEQARTHARQHADVSSSFPREVPVQNYKCPLFLCYLFLMLWVGGCIVVVFSSGFVLEPVLFMVVVWFFSQKEKEKKASLSLKWRITPSPISLVVFLTLHGCLAARTVGRCSVLPCSWAASGGSGVRVPLFSQPLIQADSTLCPRAPGTRVFSCWG